jgi:hypothetical protein
LNWTPLPKSGTAGTTNMTFSLATIKHKGTPTPTIEVDGHYHPLAIAGPELPRACA